MTDPKCTVDKCIEMLNELLEHDKESITKLINSRIPINLTDKFANETPFQIGFHDGNKTIGLLGVLNGLFGQIPDGPKKDWGYIYCSYENDDLSDFPDSMGNIISFGRVDKDMVGKE